MSGHYPADVQEIAPYLFLWPIKPEGAADSRLGQQIVSAQPASSPTLSFAFNLGADPGKIHFRVPVRVNPDASISMEEATTGLATGAAGPWDDVESPPVPVSPKAQVADIIEYVNAMESYRLHPNSASDARVAAALHSLELLIERSAATSGSLTFDWASIQDAARLSATNLEKSTPTAATLQVDSDGVQAYRLRARFPSGNWTDFVMYFCEVGPRNFYWKFSPTLEFQTSTAGHIFKPVVSLTLVDPATATVPSLTD